MQKHNYEKVQQNIFPKCSINCIIQIFYIPILKNVYINAIIQQKYSQCKSNNKNIDFICNSNGIFQKNEEIFNIDIFDICTIIGNLLNNAIEAYKEDCNNYEIRINLNGTKSVYQIEISNTIKGSVLSGNKTLKTSKSDTKKSWYRY